MKPIVIIPARMAARRLPGKPLANIGGESMIVRVWRQALAAGVGPVAVAAGDQVICDAIAAVGGQAVLTDPNLPSGSDRVLAAMAALDPAGRHDVVINLQGDMPFVSPGILVDCATLLARKPECDIATVVAQESSAKDRTNADVVKAILAMNPDGRAGRALYFTRSTLWGEGPVWRHIGIYGYRSAALRRCDSHRSSPLERRENLEQLRALEMGLTIWAAVANQAPISVDTPADLAAAELVARRAQRDG